MYGIVELLYLSVLAWWTTYSSRRRSCTSSFLFLGKRCLCFSDFEHLTPNFRHRFSRLFSRVSKPQIDSAVLYSWYLSPRMIFRHTFCTLSMELFWAMVSEECQTTQQYSRTHLMNIVYINVRSSTDVPAYLSFVISEILE